MGKIMSKETQARDVALSEYNKFMDKYKAGVESGNMKLMQHMLRLEADKIRTQSIVDAVEKSEAGIDGGVYDFEDTKMKLQMDSNEYRQDQAREQAFVKMATKDTTKEELKQAPISIGDPDKMDAFRIDPYDFGQIAKSTPAKEEVKQAPSVTPAVTIDPVTGKKVYNGPKLRNKRIVDGKEWDESHPNFMDKGVGGM